MWNRVDIAYISRNMKEIKLSMQYPLFIAVIIIFQIISPSTSAISDKRLCYDPDCSEPVSFAKTVVKYNAIESNILSFDVNVDVKVFSKSAGSRNDLWGVEIDGKRGYAPLRFLREKRVLRKELKHEVPTESFLQKPHVPDDKKVGETNSIKQANLVKNNETSFPVLDQVSPSFEVIDGTTIYLSPKDDEEEEHDSYATQTIKKPQAKEQPILSVHPNLVSSKATTAETEAVSAETGALEDRKEGSEPLSQVDELKATDSDTDTSADINNTSSEVPEEVLTVISPEKATEPKSKPKRIDDIIIAIDNKIDIKGTHDEVAEDDEAEDAVEEEAKEEESKEDDEVEEIEGSEEQELVGSAESKDETAGETVTSTLSHVFDKVTSLFEGFASTEAPEATEDTTKEKEEVSGQVGKVEKVDEMEEKAKISLKDKEASDVEEAVVIPDPEAEVPASKIVHAPELDEQAPNVVKTQSSEKIEEVPENVPKVAEGISLEETLSSSEEVPTTIPPPKIDEFVSAEVQSSEIAKEPSGTDASSEVTQEGWKVDASTEPEKVLQAEVPDIVPVPKVRKLSLPLMSGKVATIETPVPVLPMRNEKVEETVEEVEEASGTTETSVQLDSVDETIDQEVISESPSASVNETGDTIHHEDVGEVKIDKVDETFKIDESQNLTDTQDIKTEDILTQTGQPGINERDKLSDLSQDILVNRISSFNEFPGSRNLLNVESETPQDSSELMDDNKSEISTDTINTPAQQKTHTIIPNFTEEVTDSIPEVTEAPSVYVEKVEIEETTATIEDVKHVILPAEVCYAHNNCDEFESVEKKLSPEDESTFDDEKGVIHGIEQGQNYWETLSYLTLTALTTLLFSLGYFYIENTRRDGQLIARINKLEKELLISNKEFTTLDETLKSTKTKLNSIEDESFGSNEMVVSLKTDLEAANKAKEELENQVSTLEKDLESATEAGLELEKMLRELLATKNEDNPLANTIEDLKKRLDAQQSANENLTSALQLKTRENESLKNELATNVQKCDQLELEVTRLSGELQSMTTSKQEIEQSLTAKVEELQRQLSEITEQRKTFKMQLKSSKMEIKDLLEIAKQSNVNNIDLTKLSEVSKMKAEIDELKEERDDLKVKLTEVEGAHDLLEEHMRIINKEILSLTDQVKVAIKEKDEAETRLEVLTKFFQEKEAERQKEEAIWVQKKGEVLTTVEKMQILQNEIQNYKQQIETLKREVLDQEKEYKTQIAALEAKTHDQWVRARQSERRLEESKAESGQLRNRLTLIEKNLSDNESESKTHRLESNGEISTSAQLFIGAETSSSPLMFTGTSSVPPPYLYGPPMPPFLPPHLPTLPGYDVGQRPPPLGGRLSSPPPPGTLPRPPPLHTSSSRYDHSGSSPSPPISPPIPHHGHYRSNHPPPPPPLPYPNDRIPPVPLPGMLPPPHLPNTSWGEDKLSLRNNGTFHPFQRDQHPREYKGSLDLSEESADRDRSRRSGK